MKARIIWGRKEKAKLESKYFVKMDDEFNDFLSNLLNDESVFDISLTKEIKGFNEHCFVDESKEVKDSE